MILSTEISSGNLSPEELRSEQIFEEFKTALNLINWNEQDKEHNQRHEEKIDFPIPNIDPSGEPPKENPHHESYLRVEDLGNKLRVKVVESHLAFGFTLTKHRGVSHFNMRKTEMFARGKHIKSPVDVEVSFSDDERPAAIELGNELVGWAKDVANSNKLKPFDFDLRSPKR